MDVPEALGILGVGILLSSLYLQSESFVGPQVTGIALQSLLLAGFLGVLAWTEASVGLAILAALTVLLRVVVIPYILRRQITAFRWRAREHRAAHRVTGHALAAVALAILGWEVYSLAMAPAITAPGTALPFILLLEGFLMLATRGNTLVQVVGYLEEENALIYLGALFSHGFPLLVEAVVSLDVVGVVLVAVILSIQRDVAGIPEGAHVEELSG